MPDYEHIPTRPYSEGAPHITHGSDFDTGGQCAAMTTPVLLIGDVRASFRTVWQEDESRLQMSCVSADTVSSSWR